MTLKINQVYPYDTENKPSNPMTLKTRYKCCAQHNGRVANYCHVPLVTRQLGRPRSPAIKFRN